MKKLLTFAFALMLTASLSAFAQSQAPTDPDNTTQKEKTVPSSKADQTGNQSKTSSQSSKADAGSDQNGMASQTSPGYDQHKHKKHHQSSNNGTTNTNSDNGNASSSTPQPRL